jgi:hypothetical protein
MKDKIMLGCVAVVCLTIMEAIALLKGVDGYLFGIVVAAISSFAGYKIGKGRK